MGFSAGGCGQNPFSGNPSGHLETVLDDTADTAAWNWVAEIGGTVEADGADESGAVEAEEFIAVCHAAWVFLLELGGFGFNGVSVFFEFGYSFGGVVDFENAVDFADWRLFL